MRYGVTFRYTTKLAEIAPDEAVIEARDVADLKNKAEKSCKVFLKEENADTCTAVYNGKAIAFSQRKGR